MVYQSLSLLDRETDQSIVVRTEFFGVQLESVGGVRRLIIAVYMQILKAINLLFCNMKSWDLNEILGTQRETISFCQITPQRAVINSWFCIRGNNESI